MGCGASQKYKAEETAPAEETPAGPAGKRCSAQCADEKTCPEGHPLVKHRDKYMQRCARCKAETKKGDALWHCSTCKYFECEMCYNSKVPRTSHLEVPKDMGDWKKETEVILVGEKEAEVLKGHAIQSCTTMFVLASKGIDNALLSVNARRNTLLQKHSGDVQNAVADALVDENVATKEAVKATMQHAYSTGTKETDVEVAAEDEAGLRELLVDRAVGGQLNQISGDVKQFLYPHLWKSIYKYAVVAALHGYDMESIAGQSHVMQAIAGASEPVGLKEETFAVAFEAGGGPQSLWESLKAGGILEDISVQVMTTGGLPKRPPKYRHILDEAGQTKILKFLSCGASEVPQTQYEKTLDPEPTVIKMVESFYEAMRELDGTKLDTEPKGTLSGDNA